MKRKTAKQVKNSKKVKSTAKAFKVTKQKAEPSRMLTAEGYRRALMKKHASTK
jgi:hypothetical protein